MEIIFTQERKVGNVEIEIASFDASDQDNFQCLGSLLTIHNQCTCK